jgi:predicted adenine nucleotide alpha hydrolase (AANH) superfamily ATPase
LADIQGLENEPERGKRCERCFYHRLLATARKAQELGIPYFATTLASSRWKNLDQINAAGIKAMEAVNGAQDGHPAAETPRFWPQNWRKDGLQERRNALLKEYNFYNQLYCGCEFSMS